MAIILTLPGLDGFYMAGQWAEGMIGISTAAVSGRNAVRRMCRRDGRRFVTSGSELSQVQTPPF